MAAANRRQRVMLGLLIVLTTIALWRYHDVLIPRFVGERAGAAVEGLDAQAQVLQGLPQIVIERPDTAKSYTPSRNLFEFGTDPQLLAQQRAAAEQTRKLTEERQKQAEVARQAQAAAALTAPPPEPPPPRRPDFRYDYVGYIGELSQPLSYMAVLQKPGARREINKDDILVVSTGETIDDQFVVKRIGIDELEIGFTESRFSGQTKIVKLIQAKEQSR